MIIGTAGHIDHGKTALIKALTGVDADRLQEEKARGITIDLGYAYHPLANGEVLGFVDVPGHEGFVHNMLAGATGIDYVMLVVAADDGPMPQTREHLQIVDLLGLSQGLVAVTKTDLVDRERLQQVQAEIAAALAGTGLAACPLFPVSSATGAGIAALHAHLVAQAARAAPRADDGCFRLAVDRCFTLAGSGTVVTGTVHAGRVAVGDRLVVTPSGLETRVRGLHAQNRAAAHGRAGERCALNLAGIERRAVARGDWLVEAPVHAPTARLDARLRLLPTEARALRHWTPVHCHLGALDVTARVAVLEGEAIAPGAEGLVQIVLDRPIGALRGDRFILRDQSARRTVAGGQVLDPFAPARDRRAASRLAALRALQQDAPAAALSRLLECLPAGVDLRRFALAWNLREPAAQALWRETPMAVLPAPGGATGFSASRLASLRAAVLAGLAREHAASPERLGPDAARLRRLSAPTLPRALFAALIARLIEEGAVARDGPWLHLPGHRITLAPGEQALWQRVRPLLAAAAFQPPRVRDIAKRLELDERRVRVLLERVADLGEVQRVAHDHYYTREAVAELAAIAQRLAGDGGELLAARFRDAIGTGRKLAIQILEYFDRNGLSVRVGDAHRVQPDSWLPGGERADGRGRNAAG